MPRPIPITPIGPTGPIAPTAPTGPTSPSGPTAPTGPIPPPNPFAHLGGSVQTKRPNSSQPYGVPWSNVTRYAVDFIAAANEFGVDPLLLAAMAIVESDSNQFDAAGRVISRDDGLGDGPSVGIMQVKPRLWQGLVPDADPNAVRGNLRLGAAIMAQAIKQQGSWQKAITNVYFPTDDRNGTTQSAYVQAVTNLMAEMKGITPAPPPHPDIDPIRVIVGGGYPPITYGWLADAGLHYYAYGVGHGTQRDTQHTGVDVPVPRGTSLYAPVAGVVDCVGAAGTPRWGQGCGAYPDTDGSGASGNLTILLDSGHKLTLGHCSRFLVNVGQRVAAGQKVALSGGMNGPHVHVEVAINKGGTYWLVEPIAALKNAMAGRAPVVYAERVPVPQPSEWDVFCEVTATQDGVPVLQHADLGSAPVRWPLAKGETFDAVMLVLGNDKRWYWVSSLGSRIPIAGTSASDGPRIAGAA